MTIKIKVFILIIITCTLLCAENRDITLKECRHLALENNGLIKAADMRAEGAVYSKRALKTNFLPKLSFSADYLYLNKPVSVDLSGGYLPVFRTDPSSGAMIPDILTNSSGQTLTDSAGNPLFASYAYMPDQEFEVIPGHAYALSLNIRQPLYTGGKISASVRMAECAEKIAGYKREIIRENIIYEVDKLFWQCASLKERKKAVAMYCEMLKSFLDTMKDSYNVRLISESQLLKVEVEYNRGLLLKQEVEDGYVLSKMALCQKTGLDQRSDISPKTDRFESDNKLDILPQERGREQNRFDYKAFKKSVTLKEENVKYVVSDSLPVIGADAGLSRLGYKLNGTDRDKFSFRALINLKVPLFRWNESKYKRKAAEMEREAQNTEFKRAADLMKLEIKKAEYSYRRSLLKIKLAESSLKSAKKSLALIKESYDMGLETLTELLKAQTRWYNARCELIEAYALYKISGSMYRKSTGRLLQTVKKEM